MTAVLRCARADPRRVYMIRLSCGAYRESKDWARAMGVAASRRQQAT